MRTNIAVKSTHVTHEGAPARRITPEQQLRRSVMSCMLWEKEFYEDGVEISTRIAELIPKVDPTIVMNIAIEAREKMKLRHVPLWIAIGMLKSVAHKPYVAETLERIIQRADELAEVLAMYWKDGKKPIAHQLQKGLGRAFGKFNEYQLAKYNRDGAVKLRDVLFLSHAKPKDEEQSILWKKLIDGKLETPDTWEVALSSGGDKKAHWERLIKEGKLGGLAFLRNLRNMQEAGVAISDIDDGLLKAKTERVLPFRFIAAAKYAPRLESTLEKLMLKSLEGGEGLTGETIILIDVSGSMEYKVSSKSEISRLDAACGLAIILRELCRFVRVCTFSNMMAEVPARRGFALSDAIVKSQPHVGTYLGKAIGLINQEKFDRLIVITDEQSADVVPNAKCEKAYMINVASAKNGVGYKKWRHIDGWSEAIYDYILQAEREDFKEIS